MIGLILGGRYEIIEELGKGGMAIVYKAHCNLLNRMVAVKILRQDHEEDSEFLKRFNVEAQAAASLVHPNIVSIFDYGYDQGYHYIVMEYIEGITLKQYIQEKAPLDVKDAFGIAYQICDALSAAHENNIVHRDIKPHNIMITSDHRVKVTDFGIARASTGSTMTADSDILGSVHYISPEQAKGGHVDGKSDLYSLGIVIYEMLTGRVPFESDAPVAVAMKHINEAPVSPREYNPELSYSIEYFMLKAISKDINSRYQTAKDMMKDIMKLIENPDVVLDGGDDEVSDDNDATMKIPKISSDEAEPADDVVRWDNSQKKNDSENESKKNTKSKESKKIIIGAIVTALVIVGGLSLLATYILYPDAAIFGVFSSQEITVPDFYEMKLEDAEKLAQENNLVIEIKDEVQDESAQEGTIIAQTPKEGRKVKPETKIYVTVSVGAEKIEVDNFKLTKYETAKSALEKAGFHVDASFEYDDEVPENYVISQTPEGGQKAAHGSTVKLVVSKGPKETDVIVPGFVGKTLEQAKAAMSKAGLTLGDVSYEKSVVDKGTVIRQSIAGGETVSSKTAINLVISSGNDNDEVTNGDSGDKPAETDKILKCTIPSEKDEVTVKVVESGKTIYEGVFRPGDNPEFSLKVSGSGKKSYEIYADDELIGTKSIDFGE